MQPISTIKFRSASFVALLFLLGCNSTTGPTPTPLATQEIREESQKMEDIGDGEMAVIISVQIADDVAKAFHEQSSTADTVELQEVLTEFNLSVEPVHPGIDDATLIKFFIIKAPDKATADQVVRDLLKLKSVEGAYVKPAASLP